MKTMEQARVEIGNQQSKYGKVNSLMQYINEETLLKHHKLQPKGKATGVDNVTKEMYDFKDKGGRDITLRPEGTAGVIRAIVENKLRNVPENVSQYAPCGHSARSSLVQFAILILLSAVGAGAKARVSNA